MGNKTMAAKGKAGAQNAENLSFKASKAAGAGLEWRVFIRTDKLDIFSALKDKNHKVNHWGGYVEERTDNYVVVNNYDYGLKFRYGKSLELKCRVEEQLNIEGWYKRKFPIKLDDMKLDLLQQKGQKYAADDDLGKCLEHIANEDSYIIKCEKERQNGSVDGLSMEQTKCTISFLDSKYSNNKDDKKENQNDNDNDKDKCVDKKSLMESLDGSVWTSVCIEASSYGQASSSILKAAESVEAILRKIDKNYIVGSYPGWLIKLMYE